MGLGERNDTRAAEGCSRQRKKGAGALSLQGSLFRQGCPCGFSIREPILSGWRAAAFLTREANWFVGSMSQ